MGQSVGGGPAVEFAARGVGARVALLSPFASMAQMAEAAFPLVTPGVRALPALVRDKFDNLGKVPPYPSPYASPTVPTSARPRVALRRHVRGRWGGDPTIFKPRSRAV